MFLSEHRPFVAFEEPRSKITVEHQVKTYVQKDQEVYTTRDFSTSGFVMAPFNLNAKSAILFPSSKSEHFQETVQIENCPDTKPQKDILNNPSSKKEHLALVRKGITAIHDGVFKKVVLSRSFEYVSEISPSRIFQRLLQQYPEAFVYLWHHPKVGTWLGATPETLLQTENMHFKTMALASTQAYVKGKSPQWTSKEIEEQHYVTQFIRDQLLPYTLHLEIENPKNARAGNLWHLKSKIQGELKDLKSLTEVLTRLHPTPAVCGLPKEKAQSFILKNEHHNRLFYSGFLGELNQPAAEDNSSAQTQLYVNLRCMQAHSNHFRIYVGGGIVKDSIPELEWEETVNKSRTMLDVILERRKSEW